MWAEQFDSTFPYMMLLMMVALMRVAYETSHSTSAAPSVSSLPQTQQEAISQVIPHFPSAGSELVPYSIREQALTTWQKEVSEKAVKKYAEAQEKKWRRWEESMKK